MVKAEIEIGNNVFVGIVYRNFARGCKQTVREGDVIMYKKSGNKNLNPALQKRHMQPVALQNLLE